MTLIVCRAEIPFPCTSKLIMIQSLTALASKRAVFTFKWMLVSSAEVTVVSLSQCICIQRGGIFFLHVARCVIISPFFLFSLSQSVLHRFLTSLSLNRHSCLSFSAMPTWWRITPSFCLFVCFYILPPLLCTPFFFFFSSFLVSLSLSVMAYQDGFYGAADLYVSIRLSPLLPHSSLCFPPSCLWDFKCETARTKPIETCTFGCFD